MTRDQIYQEVQGSMTQFDPITEDAVRTLSEGKLSYHMLDSYLQCYGLSASHIVYDSGRFFQNVFYADYDKGLYMMLMLEPKYLQAAARGLMELAQYAETGHPMLCKHNWISYYHVAVPLPMRIYDFQKRVYEIEPEDIYAIWQDIYISIDYSNRQWKPDVLEYVFSKAPKVNKMPQIEMNGMIKVYRGMGELSQSPEEAISWSTAPENALWFANHTGRGTALVQGEILPEDVVAYRPDYYNENEIIVHPGKVQNAIYVDMFPANEEYFIKLAVPAMPDYIRYGRQVNKLGYKKEGVFDYHRAKHILRVLLLSLMYYFANKQDLTVEDKNILCYFSLMHDIGRDDEETDPQHGVKSVNFICGKKLRIASLPLRKTDYKIANLIIAYHCQDDKNGIAAIESCSGFSRKDKDRAKKLYCICKDMDGLDRVRFGGLNHQMLRTDFAKQLPLIAGCLIHEDLFTILQEGDKSETSTGKNAVAAESCRT